MPLNRTLSAQSSRLRERLTVRLIVAVPALLALLTIAFGYTVLSILFHYSSQGPGAAAVEQWGAAQKWTLVAMLFFFALAIIAGLALAFSILSPLRSISQALEKASQGALEEPVLVGGGMEMSDINKNFNSMIRYLNQVFLERNRFLMDSAQTGVLALDENMRLLEMNAVAGDLLGLEAENCRGRLLESVLQEDMNPDTRQLLEAFREVMKSGSMVQVAQSIKIGADQQRHVSFSCNVERKPDGRPQEFIFRFQDRSRGEAMTRLLARTDQLAALGAFTMGLAHELRNPLGSIKGLAQLLEESQSEDNRNFAGRIVHEVDRLDHFMRELLDFGQQSLAPPAPCDLAEMMNEALDLATGGSTAAEQKNLKIIKDLQPVQAVLLQRERILRALANVITNAFDACPEHGVVRLSCGTSTTKMRGICEIENEGEAISQENLERLFEPFFTTKPHGTGLGLAIASQIVTQNAGTLTAENTTSGVRFTFAFPFMDTE